MQPAHKPRPSNRRPWHATLLAACLLLAGCATHQQNPSFQVARDEARAALARMEEDPVRLRRPVLVLGGWLDPGIAADGLHDQLESVTTNNEPIIAVSFLGVGSFEGARDRVTEALREHDLAAAETTPAIDVVAFSLGGVVARYSAQSPRLARAADAVGRGQTPRPGLRIRRLFTISTPHRGARLAPWASWDPVVRRIRPGSPFLDRLNSRLDEAGYRLYPYVRLGDGIVGPANAAPPGRTPWWVDKPAFSLGHNAADDARIVADIARRLRGEPPFSTHPPEPLPAGARQ